MQDNHYYPYGALLGESASTEYVKAVARTRQSEVSTNQYKYSAKEWQPLQSLNLYDFPARQYDPILCRFTAPDPLNFNYPHLSPYLYCAANPINLSDPTGLAVIYNNYGDFLGTTKEGFTGNIYIYYGTEDIDFSKYSDYELRESVEFILHNYEDVASLLPNNARQAIFNNILSHFNNTYIFHKMFHMSRIYDGSIEVIDKKIWPNTIWRTFVTFRNGTMVGLPQIIGSGDFLSEYEATVENIAATLIVHEWYAHGMQHYFNENSTHHLAYKSIIDWKPLWDLTTNKYKGFVMDHFKDYYEKETNIKLTDYYYLNLYNKYIKYYTDGK